jgi:NAD-dependent dihydropyrimidine dehydrogenase PreA subunit
MNEQEWVLPEVDPTRCTGCGACVKNCPAGAVQLVNGRVVFVASDLCSYCGVCEDVCPEGAVALYYEVSLATA